MGSSTYIPILMEKISGLCLRITITGRMSNLIIAQAVHLLSAHYIIHIKAHFGQDGSTQIIVNLYNHTANQTLATLSNTYGSVCPAINSLAIHEQQLYL